MCVLSGAFSSSSRLQSRPFWVIRQFGNCQYISPGATNYIQKNEWHHVAGVYNGKEAKLYLNGALKTSSNKKGAIRDSTHTSLWIGAEPRYSRPQTDMDYYFRGTIDEVMIYNRALSSDEINRIYSFQK